MTLLFLLLIFAMTDTRREIPSWIIPTLVGMSFLAVTIAFGWQTSYALNPARDFGPRCFMAMLPRFGATAFSVGGYYFWVPIVAPFLGAIFGKLLRCFDSNRRWNLSLRPRTLSLHISCFGYDIKRFHFYSAGAYDAVSVLFAARKFIGPFAAKLSASISYGIC